MFVVQDAPWSPLEFADIQLSPVSLNAQTTRFELEVHVWETTAGLQFDFIYSTDHFAATTIQRMLDHYHTLLTAIAAKPLQHISQLPVMTADEHQCIVNSGNGASTHYPREATIHQLFEMRVDQTPDAPAVIVGEHVLSYGELNARANLLAHQLRKAGVGPEVLVGLCVERGVEMVVGMLGILKAGGAYVPLDEEYPRSRLEFMLQDARTPVIVTERRLADRLPSCGQQLILLDELRDWLCPPDGANPAHYAGPENLAYVVYTSGSTGQPKGVAVPHRAVNRLVLNTDYVALSSQDVVAQASNASFDAATFEVWGALLCGARLAIIDRQTTIVPQSFAATLRRHGVTTLFLTTALFNQLAREAPGALASLRTVLFGGEACDPRSVRAVLENGPPQRLLHVYGPTENTTFSTWHLVDHVPHDATTVPIGRPIANTSAYVLDRYRNPVPLGIDGELYLGGDGLARGYLKREELTAEKFVTDPHGEAGARLYRTGDVCRWLPDGTLEFIGRRDDQVKLRGFRVELGEVESALLAHGGITAAVAMLREDEPGEKRLVAYVVARDGARGMEAELRDYLKEQLPAYMVPSSLVLLESLPLTPNGKIDKQALPKPDGVREADGSYVAPQSETEKRIAGIWQEILQLDKVGVHDNFFELGGHSLMATQVKVRLDDAFDVEISLRSFFSGPTVRELAAMVEAEILRVISELSEDEARRLNAGVE
jgi:amino acid adenylation domain-containing protein